MREAKKAEAKRWAKTSRQAKMQLRRLAPRMTKSRTSRVVGAVQACLTDEQRQKRYRGHANPLRGQCSVASEAVYFMLGGKKSGWTPTTLRIGDETHWYLRNTKTGEIIDPTAGQFTCELEYGRGRGRGFPTPKGGRREPPPSKRATKVISCAQRVLR